MPKNNWPTLPVSSGSKSKLIDTGIVAAMKPHHVGSALAGHFIHRAEVEPKRAVDGRIIVRSIVETPENFFIEVFTYYGDNGVFEVVGDDGWGHAPAVVNYENDKVFS